MEQENKPDYGYSHVCGYNKMNKETLPFSALSVHMNMGWKGGGGGLLNVRVFNLTPSTIAIITICV